MRRCLLVLLALGVLMVAAATPASAAPVTRSKDMVKAGARVPARGAPEIATPPYKGYTYYSDLRRILRKIERKSHGRVDVDFVGKSANGNKLWTVIVTSPMGFKESCANERFRDLLLTDPARAESMVTPRSGLRIPVFINCSVHGGETTGVDAGLRLLRRLAFKNDWLTKRFLKEAIVVINPCQNPDGRITDTRPNGNGFDCNRDFAALTQPEVVITTNTLRTWLPTTMLDLHGFVDPMLIEPTTIPHNPSLEYDLFIGSALPLARDMKAALEDETGHTAQIPYLWGTAEDTQNDVNEGWDDYGPYYVPMMAQQFGSIGLTVETSSKTADGVDGHYAVSVEAIRYSIDHKWQLLKNQAEWYRRGVENAPDSVTGRPWMGNMTDMIRAAVWDSTTNRAVVEDIAWGDPGFPYSNIVGDTSFPYAYVIPVDPALQRDPLEAYKAVNHLLAYSCKVEVAKKPFTANGTVYPAGTYVVRMQQALRSLANNLLWDGEDVKAQYGVSSMYDISAWSTPYIWGYTRAKIDAPFSAWLKTVKPAPAMRVVGDPPAADYTTKVVGRTGTVSGMGPVFWWSGDNNWSVLVVNQMLRRHYPVGMVTRQIAAPNDDIPVGAFVVDTTNLPWAVKFLANRAANYGIDFTAAAGLQMAQVSTLSTPNVQVAVDANTVFVLKQQLGFDSVTSWSSSNTSIPNVDDHGRQQLEQLTESEHGPDLAQWRHLDADADVLRRHAQWREPDDGHRPAAGRHREQRPGLRGQRSRHGRLRSGRSPDGDLSRTRLRLRVSAVLVHHDPGGRHGRRDLRAGYRRSVPAGLLEQHQRRGRRQRRDDQRFVRYGHGAGPRHLHRLPPDLPRLPGQHRPARRAGGPVVQRHPAVHALSKGGRRRRSRRSPGASGKIAPTRRGGRSRTARPFFSLCSGSAHGETAGGGLGDVAGAIARGHPEAVLAARQ